MLDVLVVGAGPAGRALGAACGERGLRTRVLDPAPDRPWRASYGAWADELPTDLPPSALAARVAGRAVARREHRLDRDYAVFDTTGLREHLDRRLAAAGVPVERGHGRIGELPPAGLVVDAGGPAQPLLARPTRRRGVAAEQTAAGVVVPAELAAPLVGPGEALFMDWRPPGAGGPDRWPTFLYGIPLGGDRVLLEETSLARRPGLGIAELTDRLAARLAGLGITPPPDAPREVVRFPLDLPRHTGPGVLGFGAAAPLTHPATGYQLATALRLAPAVAAAAARGLGGGTGPDDSPRDGSSRDGGGPDSSSRDRSGPADGSGDDSGDDSGGRADHSGGGRARARGGGPTAALAATRAVLWPAGARATHLLRRRGLEALLRMPPTLVPGFFDGFFALPETHRRAYLSSRDDPRAVLAAMAGLFRTTPWPVRVRLIGSSVLVSAPPERGASIRMG